MEALTTLFGEVGTAKAATYGTLPYGLRDRTIINSMHLSLLTDRGPSTTWKYFNLAGAISYANSDAGSDAGSNAGRDGGRQAVTQDAIEENEVCICLQCACCCRKP